MKRAESELVYDRRSMTAPHPRIPRSTLSRCRLMLQEMRMPPWWTAADELPIVVIKRPGHLILCCILSSPLRTLRGPSRAAKEIVAPDQTRVKGANVQSNVQFCHNAIRRKRISGAYQAHIRRIYGSRELLGFAMVAKTAQNWLRDVAARGDSATFCPLAASKSARSFAADASLTAQC